MGVKGNELSICFNKLPGGVSSGIGEPRSCCGLKTFKFHWDSQERF